MPRYRYDFPQARVSKPTVSPQGDKQGDKQKESKKTMLYLGIFLVVVLICVVIYFVAIKDSGLGNPEKLMDLTIKELDEDVESGKTLNYNVEALNLGKAEIYDIILKHEIYTIDGQYFPTLGKEETVALKGKSVFPNSLKATLPAGTYRLKITAIYGKEKAIASKTFEVFENGTTKPESPEPEVSPEPDENLPQEVIEDPEVPDEEPGEEPDEEEPEFNKVTGLSDSELEKQALEKAGLNTQKAVDLCLSISSLYNKDFCLGQCAKKSQKDYFCKLIKEEDRKDGCYMDLALKGKPELCEKIIDGYNKNTCLALV